MSVARKKITVTLDELDDAIKALDAFQREIQQKCETLEAKIAEEIAWSAASGFSHAVVDDIIHGPRWGNVSVEVQTTGNMTVVIANGEDAVWIEFGAGVYHNGPTGQSPNKLGGNLGFTIGSLTKGKARNTWAFVENDKVLWTHGTPAAMPMWNGIQDACNHIAELAREVFA